MYKISKQLPKGYKVNGTYCGIKKREGNDIGLLYSEFDCKASGVFTKNKFQAAPVRVCKEILQSNNNKIRGIVLNSGCANAVTGELGYQNALKMSDLSKKYLNDKFSSKIEPNSILVMSTGVIGHQLDMDKIENGITKSSKELNDSEPNWIEISKSFMTTDTFHKERRYTHDQGYNLAGISKGAGMIHPNMATMLSLIITDANLTNECLDQALQYSTERSFNCITIDGDTSTNDTCLLLANGAFQMPVIQDLQSKEFLQFRNFLTYTMTELAKDIVKDGEGATKRITIKVQDAMSYDQAQKIAKTIATSSLVKTAFFGQDANWGRIAAAIGYAEVEGINPDFVSISISSLTPQFEVIESIELLKLGTPLKMDEDYALKIMKNKELMVDVSIGLGKESATVWTCDFSEGYVKVNASYRS